MKKILSIFMCALLCVTLFVVPVSASASNSINSQNYIVVNMYMKQDGVLFDLRATEPNSNFFIVDQDYIDNIDLSKHTENDDILINTSNMYYYCITNTGLHQEQPFEFIYDTVELNVKNDGFYVYIKEKTYCDGSTCAATDPNEDNICDDCGQPFTWSLRNDTYDFNGYHFATTFEFADGSTTTLNELWEGIKDSGGNVFILNDTWENALFYIVSPADNMQVVGNSYQTKDRVVVTLYSSETTADGKPYWKYSATDTRNNSGANLGTLDQIIWTAENLNDQYGFVVVDGDINFMTPLWEKVEQVTQGALPTLTTTLGGNLMTLTLCGVGLITLLVGLYLLLKMLRTYLKT